MSKTCARCQKVVYPIEELKCLDKIWHKTCFKCTECSMTLNMKTYKGFNKLPYCEAHIPKVKATAIADTPELKRIAENTKIQSNVKYHEDFEKAKGKFTQVADDPETLRIKQNTKIISNVAYHGDLEKKAIMEKQREAADLGEVIGESEYFSETLAAAQFSQFDHMPGIANTTPLISTISNSTPQQQPLPQSQQSFQQEQHISNQNHLQQLPLPQQSMHLPQNSATIMNNSQMASHANTQMLIRNQPQQHSDLTYQHYQQPQETHAQQNQQHMQQQILNTQKPSTYNQLRSTILLNSHHPAGGMQQSVQSRGSNNATGNISNSYDQQDVYTNPSTQSTNLYHPNHTNNNSIMNNSTAYPIPKTQHYVNDNMNTSKSLGSNNYNNSTPGPNMNNSILQQQKSQHPQQSLSNGSNVGNVNMIMKNMTISGANGSGGGGSNNIGKIADYDPLTDGPRQLPNTARPSTTLVYSSGTTRAGAAPNQYTKTVSSVPDLHLANGIYGTSSNNNHPNQLAQQQQRQQYYRQMIQQQQQHQQQQHQQQQHQQQQHQQQQHQQQQQQHQQQQQQHQQQQQQHQQQQHQQQQQQHQQQQQQQSQQQQLLQSQQQQHLSQQQQQLQLQQKQTHQLQQPQQQAHHSQQHHSQYTHQQNSVRPGTRIYRALYDYEAQDVDEVSFRVDDIIYEVESIDSGWMTGRVERTGKTGMLPANYVETAVI